MARRKIAQCVTVTGGMGTEGQNIHATRVVQARKVIFFCVSITRDGLVVRSATLTGYFMIHSLKSALAAQKKYGGFSESRIWKCLADLASVR